MAITITEFCTLQLHKSKPAERKFPGGCARYLAIKTYGRRENQTNYSISMAHLPHIRQVIKHFQLHDEELTKNF